MFEDIDFSKVEKEVFEEGFFSEYLPPCFKVNTKVFKEDFDNCDDVAPYCFTMSRFNGNNSRRNIYIPEIGAYVSLIKYIKDNDILKELIDFASDNYVSFSPILGKDGSIVRYEQSYNGVKINDNTFSSNYIENVTKKIIRAAGAKRIMKIDISNCYSSFYMHMVPAIILGLDKAREEFKKGNKSTNIQYKKYDLLDKKIRKQNLK